MPLGRRETMVIREVLGTREALAARARRVRLVLLVRVGRLEPLVTPEAQALPVTPALRELLVQGLRRVPLVTPEARALLVTPVPPVRRGQRPLFSL